MISATFQNLKKMLFADDTSIFLSGTNLSETMETLKQELVKVKNWFCENRLSLNWGKTKYLIFSNCQVNRSISLSTDQVEICKINEIKFLGVILDDKLK